VPDDSGGAVIVGVDAGGTSIRARAVRHGAVFYEGTGGPGNPLSASKATLEASYRAALAGCAAATHVCACVAGTGGHAQHTQIATLLARLLPGAQISVVPDYAAAFHATPEGTDVCVIAGTGSVICSQASDGTYAVAGGLGWILSDHGSATRLGQAALEHFIGDPETVPPRSRTAIERIFGNSDWRIIARTINSSAKPSELLARAAPLLTTAAEQGEAWATRRLDCEMAALAATAVRHTRLHVSSPATVRMTLSGGVWASRAAIVSFTAAIARMSEGQVEVARASADPIEGAVRLAGRMSQ
jgi:N-acetylglucosamine kinase-like BadF-type ATPase